MILTDAIGQAHASAPDARIVSLVPSITELLCDLGLASQLVGRTGFCIHPAGTVRAIPKVGGTKDVNLAKLRRLAPSHVVVNIDENEKPTVDEIARFVPHVVVTHPNAPRDNLDLVRLMGGIFCREEQAECWCADFEAEYA
ncbi:MAG TPA: helical backbone metal receptor, partial [Telluria sp.]|nr:helical backbone metal receptor [Telluria sp.]